MDILINGSSIDVTFEGERTVGDALDALAESLKEQRAVILEAELDGRRIESAARGEARQTPLGEARVLSVTAVTADGIRERFRSLAETFAALEKTVSDISFQLQSGGAETAFKTIAELSSALDAFCRCASAAESLREDIEPLAIAGDNLNTFLSGFMPVLNNFCGALSRHDIVTIGDLAEYEIAPKLAALSSALEDA